MIVAVFNHPFHIFRLQMVGQKVDHPFVQLGWQIVQHAVKNRLPIDSNLLPIVWAGGQNCTCP